MVASDEKKNILRLRAKKLARETEINENSEKGLEVVEFALAHEKYAFESIYVREVYPLKELTPLPCTPPFVLGVINVRGQILSIIDLKKFFDLPEKGLTLLNKVIILRHEDIEVGILADTVIGTRIIPLIRLQQSLPTLTGIREEYLRGVTEDRSTLLDAAAILSDEKIIVQEEIEK